VYGHFAVKSGVHGRERRQTALALMQLRKTACRSFDVNLRTLAIPFSSIKHRLHFREHRADSLFVVRNDVADLIRNSGLVEAVAEQMFNNVR
jgi:hypothetical protein